MSDYIETDCKIELAGRCVSAGGTVVTEDRLIAYPAANGVLADWHGRPIGRWSILSTWKTPRSFVSSTLSSILASVDGVEYVGRGAGIGMIFQGKRRSLRAAHPTEFRMIARLTRAAMRVRLAGNIAKASDIESRRDAILSSLPRPYRIEAEELTTDIETG